MAAGDSSRFGNPKQLLAYHSQPFVRYITKTALTAGLEPIVFVSGCQAERIEQEVKGLSIIISRNTEWQNGQSTSIVTGIKSLPENIDAALFLLGDQPQITVAVIEAVIHYYVETNNPIVFPEIHGIRSHPVLFDKTKFKDLLKLKGDIGGRQIFDIHHPSHLHWEDERLLMDVDTPADYENLISGKLSVHGKSSNSSRSIVTSKL